MHGPKIFYDFGLINKILSPDPRVRAELVKIGTEVPKASKNMRDQYSCNHTLDHTENSSVHFEGSCKFLQVFVFSCELQNFEETQNFHHSIQTW